MNIVNERINILLKERLKFSKLLAIFMILGVAMLSSAWTIPSATHFESDAKQTFGPQATGNIATLLVEDDGISVQAVGSSTVTVGDTFSVTVVAIGVTEPGIFGGQFDLSFETTYLQGVAGSLVSSGDLDPVLVAVSSLDNTAGSVRYAASRQGNVDNVTGDVAIATLSFEAISAVTNTTIHLSNVKLGAKGGIEVPIGGTVDLHLTIVDDQEPPVGHNVTGQVTLQGRAAGNYAGTTVSANDGETATDVDTNADGNYSFVELTTNTYSFTADAPGYLAAVCEGKTVDADLALATVELLAGDVVDDDVIDITDATAIGVDFGNTGAGLAADLNADEVVDVLDLILMSANYGVTADPWTC